VGLIIGFEDGSHLIPELAGNDGLVLPWVALVFVVNLADVDVSVTQHFNTTTSMGRLTRLQPPRRRACGWEGWSRWDTSALITFLLGRLTY
jgi:hypothetical protein